MHKSSNSSESGQLPQDARAPRGDIDYSLQQSLKQHGIFRQCDRDSAAGNTAESSRQKPWFMIRVRVPVGGLTAAQYLALDQLAEDFVHNRSLRITCRQNLQLHGVLEADLAEVIQRVHDPLLASASSSGHGNSIVAPTAPLETLVYRTLRRLARGLAEGLLPSAVGFPEVWLDGARLDASCNADELARSKPLNGQAATIPPAEQGVPIPAALDDERLSRWAADQRTADTQVEPFGNRRGRPRKFKVGLALPEDNSVEVHHQDVGLVGVVEAGQVRRLNVLVGGSAGLAPTNPATSVRLGTPLGSIEIEHAVELVTTLRAMAHEYAASEGRPHVRLKVLVERLGMESFQDALAAKIDFPLFPWIPMGDLQHQDWLGPHEQGDGRWFYGIHIENGRIVDAPGMMQKSAVRRLVEALRPRVLLTPAQNLLLADLCEEQIVSVERVLRESGMPVPREMSSIRRHWLTCPSLPTCSRAFAETERVQPEIAAALEQELQRLGMDDIPATIRLTGCPNGCVRPYSADIGIVGCRPDHYDIYVGGGLRGDRLGVLFAPHVATADLVSTLRPLLEAWAREHLPGEPLGDYFERCSGSNRRKDAIFGRRRE